MDFDTAFHQLLGHEGEYVNHPADPGGETMWGVTKRVAQANGYTGDMRNLPVDVAKSIYRRDYWEPCKCDLLPPVVRYPVFDAAVNSGVRQAALWLQRAVGSTIDGKIGSHTIMAAGMHVPEKVASRILSQRLRFMTDLRGWPTFGKGWARRIADLLEASSK